MLTIAKNSTLELKEKSPFVCFIMLVLHIDLLSLHSILLYFNQRTKMRNRRISGENLLNKLHHSLESILIWDYRSSDNECAIYVFAHRHNILVLHFKTMNRINQHRINFYVDTVETSSFK